MKTVGLKFLLTGQHFFMAVMEEVKALEIVRKWQDGTYHLSGPARIGEVTPQGAWAIDVKEIVGLHTFDPNTLGGQQATEVQRNPWGGGSGLRN